MTSLRDLFTPPDKKTRKERQKEEQAELSAQKRFSNASSQHSKMVSSDRVSQAEDFDEVDEEEEVSLAENETQKVEVLDYEDLLDDYGF